MSTEKQVAMNKATKRVLDLFTVRFPIQSR